MIYQTEEGVEFLGSEIVIITTKEGGYLNHGGKAVGKSGDLMNVYNVVDRFDEHSTVLFTRRKAEKLIKDRDWTNIILIKADTLFESMDGKTVIDI